MSKPQSWDEIKAGDIGTVKQIDHKRAYQVWDEAHAEDDEHSGGWGQPDGMSGTTEAEYAARGRALIEQAAAAQGVDLEPATVWGPMDKAAILAKPIDSLMNSGVTPGPVVITGSGTPEVEQQVGPYPADVLPPTEARTGISNCTAAALADVAELRREAFRLWSAGTVGRLEALKRADRIEAALRGGAA